MNAKITMQIAQTITIIAVWAMSIWAVGYKDVTAHIFWVTLIVTLAILSKGE